MRRIIPVIPSTVGADAGGLLEGSSGHIVRSMPKKSDNKNLSNVCWYTTLISKYRRLRQENETSRHPEIHSEFQDSQVTDKQTAEMRGHLEVSSFLRFLLQPSGSHVELANYKPGFTEDSDHSNAKKKKNRMSFPMIWDYKTQN